MSIQWDSHTTAQQAEDVDFLLDNGASLTEACRRAGVSVDAYDRRRHARKESA